MSDLSAAKETDLLFAKAGRGMLTPIPLLSWVSLLTVVPDLVTFCEREKVPFRTFRNFYDILTTVKDIAAGKLSVKEAASGRQ